MRLFQFAIVCALTITLLAGCGAPPTQGNEPSVNPVATATAPSTGSAVEIRESPTPPPTPRPTATPRPPDTPTPRPSPTPTEPPDPQGSPGEGNGQEGQAEAQATPTPEPTAEPTPTSGRFQPVQPPDLVDVPGSAGGVPIFQFSSGPRIDRHVLSFSGTVTDRPDLAGRRWTVQVWQAQYEPDLTGECSTEKPVAFVMAPSGSGSNFVPAATPYTWTYCIQGQGFTRTHDVPWVRADRWDFGERRRQYTTEPRIWDLRVRVDLNDERVRDLEYVSPAGWTVVIFAGETLVAREWVGF